MGGENEVILGFGGMCGVGALGWWCAAVHGAGLLGVRESRWWWIGARCWLGGGWRMGRGGGGNEKAMLCGNNVGKNLMKIFPNFFHFFIRMGGVGGVKGRVVGWEGWREGRMNQ